MAFELFVPRPKDRPLTVNIWRSMVVMNAAATASWARYRPGGTRGRFKPGVLVYWDVQTRKVRLRIVPHKHPDSYALTCRPDSSRSSVTIKKFFTSIGFDTSAPQVLTAQQDGADLEFQLPRQGGAERLPCSS